MHRSIIARLNRDGNTVSYIYCHYDCFGDEAQDLVGKMLKDRFSKLDKVDELIRLGGVSVTETHHLSYVKAIGNGELGGWTVSIDEFEEIALNCAKYWHQFTYIFDLSSQVWHYVPVHDVTKIRKIQKCY